jgi:hypothetical protein
MSAPDPLATLLRDLDALAPADRRAILRTLSAAERKTLDVLRSDRESAAAERSPWLEALVAMARRGEGSLTPRTREALLAAVGGPAPIRPSLLQAAGSAMLLGRGGR